MARRVSSAEWPRVARTAGFVVAAVALAVASFDTAIGWVVPMALAGGALVATLLLMADARHGHASRVVDRFERDDVGGTINISRVRVAGIGGLGLVLAAGGVALQYELTTAAIAAGLVGGVCLGVLLIAFRKPRHASH